MEESIRRVLNLIVTSPKLINAHLHVFINKHGAEFYPIIIEMYKSEDEDSAERYILNLIQEFKPSTLKICYKISCKKELAAFPVKHERYKAVVKKHLARRIGEFQRAQPVGGASSSPISRFASSLLEDQTFRMHKHSFSSHLNNSDHPPQGLEKTCNVLKRTKLVRMDYQSSPLHRAVHLRLYRTLFLLRSPLLG